MSRITWKRFLIGFISFGLILLGVFYFTTNDPTGAWTGLGQFEPPPNASENFDRGKTLWDWMNLLLVPLVLFGLGTYFTELQKKNDRELQEHKDQANRDAQTKKEQAEQQLQEHKEQADRDAQIKKEQAEQQLQERKEQFEIVQGYLDKMQVLISDKNLGKPGADALMATIARALTTTTLDRLRPEYKHTILAFLSEANLIQSNMWNETLLPDNRRRGIIALMGANLSGVGSQSGLAFMNLSGADLRFADLTKAKLDDANFKGANLEGAMLNGSSLVYADFSGANLEGVFLEGANLFSAKYNTKTILPNGERWSIRTNMADFGAIFEDLFTEDEYKEIRRELRYKIDD